MIRFLDPRAEPGAPIEPYDLEVDLESDRENGSGSKLGLLANGFPDSVAFLEEVGRALRERLPALEIRHYDKGNASVIADEDLVQGIAKECRAVITAYGH